MTIWNIDILWAMMLLGIALFTGCCVVFNPVLKSVRIMGVVTAYAVGAYMAYELSWRVALTTWCVFAAAGGAIAFAYELWARRRYAGSGRAPRPLVAVQGFLLWPTMIPDAVEGVLVDAGVLGQGGGATGEFAARRSPSSPEARASAAG
ncbi:MAG: hypothetical protein MUF53_09425 [Gemmatimonadaceae bacterium]|nr:hypothetical protein [Gemmatimonadaceae bacterium]